MLWDGCLVHVEGPADESRTEGRKIVLVDEGITTLAASGVLLGNGMVLIPGNTVTPFLECETEKEAQGSNSIVAGTNLVISTELYSNEHEEARKRRKIEGGRFDPTTPAWYQADFLGIFELSSATRVASQMLLERDTYRLSDLGFASIAVLKIRNPMSLVWPAHRQVNVVEQGLRRGDPLVVVSSPFGLVSSKVFRNSLSSGIVSNVFYEDNNDDPSLVLTDSVLHPGSEGGGVSDVHGRLVGLVAPSLVRKGAGKESFELTVVLPIEKCWKKKRQRGFVGTSRPQMYRQFLTGVSRNTTVGTFPRASTHSVSSIPRDHNSFEIVKSSRRALEHANRSLSCIKVGRSWASGIVLNKSGYILTCAHLFVPFLTKSLKLKREYSIIVKSGGGTRGGWERAKLVYVCTHTIDLALVKIAAPNPEMLHPVTFSPGPTLPGQAAIVLGHAIFDPSFGFLPSVSKGVVSKVTYFDGEPAIVQSTARVYRGDSGGMLLDDEGKLIGVVTSNARSFDGSIIPSINFSVPKNLFAPLVEPKNAIEHMERLDRADQNLDALWNLEDVELPVQAAAIQSFRSRL